MNSEYCVRLKTYDEYVLEYGYANYSYLGWGNLVKVSPTDNDILLLGIIIDGANAGKRIYVLKSAIKEYIS